MKLSIIIPIYNCEKYLKRCLDSILAQTMQDYEILMINDGSTDNSGLIASEYSKMDERFILYNSVNKGPGHARNIGIKHAKGTYISFIDSDDTIEPSMYQNIFEKTKKDQLDVIIFGYSIISSSGQKIKAKIDIPSQIILYEKDIRQEILYKYYKGNTNGIGSLWNKIYRLQFLIDYNLFIDETRKRAEDYWYNMYVFLNCKKALFINECYYNYYQNSSSIMHTFREEDFDNYILTRKELLRINTNLKYELNYNEFYKPLLYETIMYLYKIFSINDKHINKAHKIQYILDNEVFKKALFMSALHPFHYNFILYLMKKNKKYILYCIFFLWSKLSVKE